MADTSCKSNVVVVSLAVKVIVEVSPEEIDTGFAVTDIVGALVS